MSCARSSGGVREVDPNSGLGGLSSTCLSSTCSLEGNLGEASKIFGGWIEKSIGGSGVTIKRICGSFGKSSKTEEADREARK